MFDLLNPLYFYIAGSIGVMIPLILHLIQTRRTVRLPFSTVRFLKLAQRQSATRIRMENILLWLLRTLLLLALALAFAMPLLRNRALGQWFGRSPRDVAIVIDGSYSMAYDLGGGTVWEKAVETAVALVESLSEQDRLCLFVARDRVDPVIEQLTGDREEAVGRLKSLAFRQSSSELAPAVMAANAALLEAEGRREREIHIISDNQALPWDSFGAGSGDEAAARDAGPGDGDADAGAGRKRTTATMGAWDPDKIDEKTVCFVSLLGAADPENIAPVDVRIEPPVTMARSPSKAVVRLGYTGLLRATTATLFVDGNEIASRSIEAGPGGAGELSFIIPPLSPGRHAARVETPDDNLMLDNAFYFVLKAEDRFPALCVGSRDDTFFLRAALSAGVGGDASIEADTVEPAGLQETKLGAYACVFLVNAIPLSAGAVNALERFVEDGGLLAVFPGDSAAVLDYQAWTCLPGVPTAVRNVPRFERKRLLHWDDPRHPLLDPLNVEGAGVTVTVRRTLAWDDLDEQAERLVSQDAEHAFLLSRPHGRGHVLFFAVAADRTWSDFPLSPFYLPIVHQVVQFAAGVGSYTHSVWCTDRLALAPVLPEATVETRITGPDGEPQAVRSAAAEARTVLHLEDVWKAGIYRMQAAGGAGESVPALAVNMTRAESNLAPLEPDRVRERLGLKHVHLAFEQEELMTQIRDSRVGRTFGEQLLWLAFCLAVAEFFVANRLSQPRSGLSESLVMDPSGRIQEVG